MRESTGDFIFLVLPLVWMVFELMLVGPIRRPSDKFSAASAKDQESAMSLSSALHYAGSSRSVVRTAGRLQGDGKRLGFHPSG